MGVRHGNLTFRRRDIVSGLGERAYFSRVYDSRIGQNRDFGPGWRLSLAEELTAVEGGLVYTDGSGARHFFTLASPSERGRRGEPQLSGQAIQLDADGARVRPSRYIASGTYAAFPETPRHAATAIEIFGPLAVLRDGPVTRVFEREHSDSPVYTLRTIASGGETLALSYWNGRINTVSDSTGVVFDVTRDRRGRIVSVQDRWGRSVHYGYDAGGRLTETQDLAGHAWRYEYGSHGRLTRAIGPNSNAILRIDYDAAGRVIQSHSGREYSFSYAPNETVVTEGIGHVHVFGHNDAGVTNRLDSSNGIWWRLALDGRNRVTAIQSSNGEHRFDYGPQGRITNTVEANADGIESSAYQHDDRGRIVSVYSQDGANTTVDYAGGVTRINGPQAPIAFEVLPSGKMAQVEQDGTVIRVDYDAEGHLAALHGGASTVQFNHDFMGRVSDIEYAGGEVNRYSYDALGNRSSIDFSSGGAVRYTHDPAGNIVEVAVTEPDGEEKRQFVEIGDMNRVENITYEGMGALDITYDGMGRAVSFNTGRDVISVEYAGPDRIGRITSQATGATWSPNEDGAGQRKAQDAMDARREILQNDFAGTTHPDYGIVAFDGISFAVDARAPMELGVPGLSEARRVFAVAEPLLSGNEHGAMMGFEKPSNAVFQPLEYRSTNCCICIIIYPRSVPRNDDDDDDVEVVCICLPTPSSPLPFISIVTPPPSDEWYIDNKSKLKMPDIEFVAQLNNIDHGTAATFLWKLEMVFDERRAKKYTHIKRGVTTSPTWSPYWGSLLAGANKMTVSVTAFVGGSTLAASRSGYEIHGENPTQEQIFTHADLLEEKAMCWYESSFRQFNAAKYTGIGLPRLGAPDGWGLMQRDPLPSEAHLWNWDTNMREGTAYLGKVRGNAYDYLIQGYLDDRDDGFEWSWKPTTYGAKVWDDAFSRYHSGPTMYRTEGGHEDEEDVNGGNGGEINSTQNQNGRRAACIVRCYMNRKPWVLGDAGADAAQLQCAAGCAGA